MVSIHIPTFFLGTCDWMLFICTAMFKVLTPVPQDFSISHRQYGWHHPIHGNVTESATELDRKCATWWLPSTLWSQDVCMHIDVQAWVVHLIVYGIDTWGWTIMQNSVFQQKWLWFHLFNIKKSGYEIDTLFFQITQMLLKCITLYFFS